MFDKVEITLRAGDGGDGVVSFRRERFVPFGGPDGGDGGSGGDIVIVAGSGITDLRMFRQRGFYGAADGKNGGGGKRHGKKGEDLVLMVPVGTVVLSKAQIGGDTVIADLGLLGQQAVIARGGRGGWGNTRFASATNQSPQLAQKGEVGEEASVILELRLIADVGIIGYPNVGKSTLLAAASAAKPRVASYPFTTLEPVLGMVEVNQRSFVLAEIPGLLDGAYLGRGLGHDFLRHIVRTKMLIHLIDGSSMSPVDDMIRVNAELSLFNPVLARKPQIVAVNKIDLDSVQARLAEIKNDFSNAGTVVLFISAVTGQGVPQLMAETMKLLQSATVEAQAGGEIARKVFRPRPRSVGASVHKEGDAFVVVAPELERIVDKTGATSSEVLWQLRKQLTRLGVGRALEKAGVKPGDKVRCGNLEWEW